MLLSWQTKLMAPVNRTISRRPTPEDPNPPVDVHPGVIMDLMRIDITRGDGTVERGVPAAVVAVKVKAQEENGGTEYVTLANRGRPIPTRYLRPRAIATADGESLLIPGLDDFESPEDLQAVLHEENDQFLASGGLAARAAARGNAAEDGLAQ